MLPRRSQRPACAAPDRPRHAGTRARAPAEQGRRELLRGRDRRGLGHRARIRTRRRGGGRLHGVGGDAHELLGALELAVLLLERFRLEPERAAGRGRKAAADLGAQRAAEVAADGAAGERQRLLGDALQDAADRLADRRADDRAGDAADLLDEVAEEAVELGFVGDLEQLAGELDSRPLR